MTHKISDVIWELIQENKSTVVLYLLFSLSFPITDVLLPQYYAKIIDNPKTITANVYPIAIMWFVVIILNYIGDYLDSCFKPLLKGTVRTQIVENVLENFKESFQEQHVGDLTSKLVKLPNVVTDIFHQIRNYIIPTAMILIFSTVYFFSINRKLGLIATGSIILFLIIMAIFINSCIQIAMEMDNSADQLHEEIGDVFEGLANIYAASKSQDELDRLGDVGKYTGQLYSDTITCAANFNILFTIAYLATFSGIIYYGYTLCKSNDIRSDQLISVIIISLYIISHLKNATTEVRDFIFNIGIVKKTQSYLDKLFEHSHPTSHPTPNSTSYPSSKQPVRITDGNIVFDSISLQYPNATQPTLEQFSLSIPSRQKLAIMGKIASGKTSLVRALLKFYPLSRGKILIDGQDILSADPDSLRSQIMYIPQHPVPFNRSLYENISYGTGATFDQVAHTLDSLNLVQFFHPLSLTSTVGKKGERLSGGQKQMVFILRCLLRKSPIIVLDEPTSALDANSKQTILDMLKILGQNSTMIVITHDPDVLSLVDRKIEMIRGKIVSDVKGGNTSLYM